MEFFLQSIFQEKSCRTCFEQQIFTYLYFPNLKSNLENVLKQVLKCVDPFLREVCMNVLNCWTVLNLKALSLKP